MGELARVGDNLIVRLGRGNAERAESYGKEQRMHAVKEHEALGILERRRHENHGRALEEVGAGVGES